MRKNKNEIDELAEDAPVYDARGNVRPRGTKGARPMTFEQRAEIARRIAEGEEILTAEEEAAQDVEEPQNGSPKRRVVTKKKK